MKNNISVGIIGTGYGNYVILEALNKLNFISRKIIYGRNKLVLNKILLRKKVNQTYISLKKFLKNESSLICLATTPNIQFKILNQINIKKYNYFFLEKPLANNFKNSKKIYLKFKNIKSKVAIDFMFLGLESFLKFKKIINNKKILEVNIKWHFKAYHYKKNISNSWKKNKRYGGGIYYFFIIHVIAYINFFFGRIKKVIHKEEMISNSNEISGVILKLICFKNIKINLDFNSNSRQNIHNIEVCTKNNKFKIINKSKNQVKNFKILKLNNLGKIIERISFKHKFPSKDPRVQPVIKLLNNLLIRGKPTSNISDGFNATVDLEKIINNK